MLFEPAARGPRKPCNRLCNMTERTTRRNHGGNIQHGATPSPPSMQRTKPSYTFPVRPIKDAGDGRLRPPARLRARLSSSGCPCCRAAAAARNNTLRDNWAWRRAGQTDSSRQEQWAEAEEHLCKPSWCAPSLLSPAFLRRHLQSQLSPEVRTHLR